MSVNGRFFITGLPRSRTAWMSAFFSLGNTLCYHEPISRIQRLEDLAALYEAPMYQHVGFADSGLGFHTGWILEHLQPRTLIILRPRQEVESSLTRLGLPRTNQVALLENELYRWIGHRLVRTISFSLLDNRRAMERAWFHLMPGVPFDEERHRQFCEFNIQADLNGVRQRVAANREGLQNVLGDVLRQVSMS